MRLLFAILFSAVAVFAQAGTDIKIDFTTTQGPFPDATWNVFAQNPKVGASLTSLKDSSGRVTPIAILVNTNFTSVTGSAGGTTGGKLTGNDSGVYPDAVIGGLWYADATSVGGLKIQGLNAARSYRIDLLASRAGTGTKLTQFTAQGQSQQIEALNNSSTLVTFTTLVPNSAGEIQINVQKAGSASFGYLNALVLTENAVNSAPIISAINPIVLAENSTQNIAIQVADPEGNPVVLSAVNLPVFAQLSALNNGTATLSLSPSFLQSGNYAFQLIATDSLGAVSTLDSTISVTNVNRSPTIVSAVPSVVVNEGQQASLQITASDADGDALTFSTPEGLLPFTAIQSADATSITYRIAPSTSEVTADTLFNFKVRVTDGSATSDVIVPITVKDVTVVGPPTNPLGAVANTTLLKTPTLYTNASMYRVTLATEWSKCTAGSNLAAYNYRAPYYAFLPTLGAATPAPGKYPVVVFLHGKEEQAGLSVNPCYSSTATVNGQIETNMQKVLIAAGGPPTAIKNSKWSPAQPMVVIAPQSQNWGGFPTDNMDTLLRDAAYRLKLDYGIELDADRVYFTGLSMGGGGVKDYITAYPKRLAAIVMIESAGTPDTCAIRQEGLPFWNFAGLLTGQKFNGGLSTMIKGSASCPQPYTAYSTAYPSSGYACTMTNSSVAPGTLSCTQVDPRAPNKYRATWMPNDGHSGWTSVYDRTHTSLPPGDTSVYNWMMQFKNSDRGNAPFPFR